MSKITTLQIGGPTKDFKIVHTEQELLNLIKNNPDFLIIGGGSNLLVADEGINKLVIKNEISGITTSKAIHPRGEKMRLHLGGVISVKSGTLLQTLVDYSIEHGLTGLQKLTGIPGTVGGAVFGNAGAYGQTISDNLIKVVILSTSSVIPAEAGIQLESTVHGSRSIGRPIKYGMTKQECNFGYRDSIFKKTHDIILEVSFQLEPADPKTLAQEAKEVLSKRLVKYPKGIKCPGSFFKNIVAETLPKEILDKVSDKIIYGKLPAGALLEQVGAKGQSLDGIEIASYHANLFINNGGGSAKAFYNLAQKYALLVKQRFGITLAPEVQLINLPPII